MRKSLKLTLIILFSIILILIVFELYKKQNDTTLSKNGPCKTLMTDLISLSTNQKQSFEARSKCDDETLEEVNALYAKDKNYVYFKTRPNASNDTIIVEGADPKTFRDLKGCSESIGIDKNYVYRNGKIIKKIGENPFKNDSSYFNDEENCYLL